MLPHRRVSVGTCWRSAAAGFNNPTSESLATLWAVGAVNVVATLVAVLCVVTFVYVRWFLPETKGKTLEEVSNMWADPAELQGAISTWR